MRVLMFGWEFPPHISGGLGTACFGITEALARKGSEVMFVLPKVRGGHAPGAAQVISAADVPVTLPGSDPTAWLERVDIHVLDSILRPYLDDMHYKKLLERFRRRGIPGGPESQRLLEISGDYGPNLLAEVARYSEVAAELALREDFDVIHAHDWMAIPAGIRAKAVSGRPLFVHAHALEYDRSGENINPDVFSVERTGMAAADRVFAVSHFTKARIVERYGIPAEKITVVHNAVSRKEGAAAYRVHRRGDDKVVLFLGRITFQKGPDYFVEAAGRVLARIPNVRFVMAGSGDMTIRMVERVASLQIGSRFHFTGFLRGTDVERMYALSDLYVMPSVAEPFGISPLEAVAYDVPVIVSKQSGVSEVLQHALKVDFWDIDEIANKVIAVLQYPALSDEMIRNCREELKILTWDRAAETILGAYHSEIGA